MNTTQGDDRSTQNESQSQAVQPESGAVEDRELRQDIRQSSPTNPRVEDKNEEAMEEP
ncbi:MULTISPECIES: hypothetical protein [unclassified Leptolyngbya]|uniref:hypothetical protein n=1 Tax=unclassified Leptolyngbya TaxID=2650499 RepID=UPI0016876626|nr:MULTISPECIES: hypothetical protein [unclassified Leptolyngbya]MBD1912499.1 hypothetical protein [Leptolyngbya sp. FACHB-8]MBD2156490.1 hypothetical protein [Leptolyngbya sp. FACHB-16]